MRKRQGFTLVEMLVVMAIVLIIMVILSRTFGDSLAVLRRAKGMGDLQEKLRAATSVLRRDLAADHFDGKKRVSDWVYDWRDPDGGSNWPPAPRRVPKSLPPIRQGVFRVMGSSVPSYPTLPSYADAGTVLEGTDDTTMASYRVNNRALHLTVKLRGNDPQQFFSAKVPVGSPLNAAGSMTSFFNLPVDAHFQDTTATDTFNSQWAEVYYYLRDKGATAGNTKLYALYRGQYLLVANNGQVNGKVGSGAQSKLDYGEISCTADPNNTGMLYFNTPEDMAAGRFSSLPPGPAAGDPSSDPDPGKAGTILLNDVVSFEVSLWNREMWYYLGTKNYNSGAPGVTCFQSASASNPFMPGAVYSSPSYGAWNVPVDAIRITLRVWDIRTEQTRQITLWQDL